MDPIYPIEGNPHIPKAFPDESSTAPMQHTLQHSMWHLAHALYNPPYLPRHPHHMDVYDLHLIVKSTIHTVLSFMVQPFSRNPKLLQLHQSNSWCPLCVHCPGTVTHSDLCMCTLASTFLSPCQLPRKSVCSYQCTLDCLGLPYKLLNRTTNSSLSATSFYVCGIYPHYIWSNSAIFPHGDLTWHHHISHAKINY